MITYTYTGLSGIIVAADPAELGDAIRESIAALPVNFSEAEEVDISAEIDYLVHSVRYVRSVSSDLLKGKVERVSA